MPAGDRSFEAQDAGIGPLLERFRTRQATIGIIGLGYVGLPLALTAAKAGLANDRTVKA